MRVRVADRLWDRSRPEREDEWRDVLMDLNAELGPLPESGATIVIDKRDDGGADLIVTHEGREATVALTFDMLRDAFRDYREVIGRLARADAGALGMRDFETLDYAKKLVHDEAGHKIRRALRGVMPIEHKLARQLFTIVFLVVADIPAALVTRSRRHGSEP